MPDDTNRQVIWKYLWDQLEKARYEQAIASSRFDLLVRSVSSGLPDPDAALVIQKATQEANAALLRYMGVLKKFTDFTLYGTVPEDLLPPEPTGKTAE
uniref:Uncharacterized protein n=1 Tax=Solibacter usitatus (strain Ellin6076) TaxID=234267 RepID=Q01TN2_SOLUE